MACDSLGLGGVGSGGGALASETSYLKQIEDTLDTIEIPARGRCKVFMAKYGYDPFKQSPNEIPDAELALNAGDYIMVFDDIDEDGYFIGELMDGRRGYVPSNWLARLTGEDLFEFQANVLYKQAGSGGGGGGGGINNGGQQLGDQNHHHHPKVFTSTTTGASLLLDGDTLTSSGAGLDGYPPEFYDAIIADTMNHSNFQHLLAPEDYHRMNDYVDLDDVDEVDDECLSDYERAEAEQMRRAVPPPQRLILERQLNKSILIAWLHPQAAKGTIVSYQVYVDGVLKSTVPSGDRTKALLEGVDSNLPHRISVRAIDLHGRHSNDAGCTIVVGQKIPFAPSCVKASHITSHSALISWLPCNSNFHHVVAVNSVEISTVRPGVYKHLVQGLSANTLYRVWVRAKPGKILPIDEKNPKKLESLTTYVDFKTMPKSLPDPPVNVQVEAGPQRRTLLVTWLPLTLNDYGGSSNGCAVTGYAVFAGHKKLADIDSPTGDHALLDIGDLESLHKKSVTVRTKSGENLSQDSMPCHIPDEYLKAGSVGGPNSKHLSSGGVRQVGGGVVVGPGGSSSSPSRQRLNNSQGSYSQQRALLAQQRGGYGAGQQHQQTAAHRAAAAQQQRASRPLTRSLQNLESDLESRRSSIPAIEITRETSGSDTMMLPRGGGVAGNHHHPTTESFSEEEFENSMRLRGAHRAGGGGHLSKMSGRHPGQVGRFRSRQSHSVEDHHHNPHLISQQHHNNSSNNNQLPRQFHSQASLAATAAARVGRGTTPLGTSNQNEVHYFVALFDYDPSTMSPNPNAAAEELAFKEGSIIKIYGSLGEDGFYKGELVDGPSAGTIGYVPCNVITEITDPSLLVSLYERNGGVPVQAGQQQQQHPMNVPAGMSAGTATATGQFNLDANANANRQVLNQQQQSQAGLDSILQQQQQQLPNQATGGGAVKRMVALYDYDPQENSPNADTESEIPFKTADVIYVYGKMDTDGFYMGEVERTKQRGLVPSNFLREEPLAGQKPMQQQQQQQPLMANNQQNMQMQPQFTQQVPNQQQQPMSISGQFNQQQQMQQLRNQQQQNMIRGQLVGGAPQQQQQVQAQQNINRPNSLSLGQTTQNNPQQGQMMMNTNPQQQMAMMQQNGINSNQQAMLLQQGANKNSAFNQAQQPGNQFMGGGNQMLAQQQQQQRNQQMNMQQQLNQQQQNQGGVLGNLLTSGKQMIGATTTARMPNQPGANFSQTNQGQPVNQMMATSGGGQNMMPNQNSGQMMMNQPQGGANFGGVNSMQQQQQPQSAMNAFNQVGGFAGQNQQQQPGGMMNATNIQQQQPLGHNSYVPPMGGGSVGVSANNLMGMNNQPAAFNNLSGGGSGMQQAGNFNNRATNVGMPMLSGGGGSGMNQMGGEEPGLLNTVKNIFKL